MCEGSAWMISMNEEALRCEMRLSVVSEVGSCCTIAGVQQKSSLRIRESGLFQAPSILLVARTSFRLFMRSEHSSSLLGATVVDRL